MFGYESEGFYRVKSSGEVVEAFVNNRNDFFLYCLRTDEILHLLFDEVDSDNELCEMEVLALLSEPTEA